MKLSTHTEVGIWMLLALIAFCFGFCKGARAETTVELGAPFLSGDYSRAGGLYVSESWETFSGARYSVGMGYISEQVVHGSWERDRGLPPVDVQENLYVVGQRIFVWNRGKEFTHGPRAKYPQVHFGLGVGYFNATTRWNGSKFVAALSVQYRFNKEWSVGIRHFSNAGSATPNMGQDMLVIGRSF